MGELPNRIDPSNPLVSIVTVKQSRYGILSAFGPPMAVSRSSVPTTSPAGTTRWNMLPAPRCRDLHATAEQLDSFPDAQQSEPAGTAGFFRIESPAPVGHGQADISAPMPQPQSRLADPGVLDHIEQHLLGRLVEEWP